MKKLVRMSFRDRLASLTDDRDVCWNWPGRLSYGYGRAWANLDERGPRVWMAHRASYTLLVGPVPAALQLDHLCRNRRCVNPRHLEPVTARVNTLRSESFAARNAVKTHCVNGHAFTAGNTRIIATTSGSGRSCKACERRGAVRAVAKSATSARGTQMACKYGHAFDDANTGIRKNGKRYCRHCERDRSRANMAAYRKMPKGREAQRAADRRYYETHHAECLAKAAVRRTRLALV